MRNLTLALALTLTACGRDYLEPKDTILVDPAFTPEELAQVEAATYEWHRATAGTVDLRLVVAELDVSRPYLRRIGTPAGTQCGFTMIGIDSPVLIAVAPRCGLGPTYTAIHELGHAFGLDHGQGRLMDPADGPESRPCIDAETLDVFCSDVAHCHSEARPTCKE
jgi:hypothetical protein